MPTRRSPLDPMREERPANIVVLKPRAAIPTILSCVEDLDSVLVWGGVGIGKSQIVAQIARTLSLKLFDGLRASMLDAVDVRGMPMVDIEKAITKWARPEFIPATDEGPCLLFLDEITRGNILVQNALMMLTQERRIGELRLPDTCAIVAATNRETDGGGTYKMPSALANRFTHIEIEPDLNDWCQWAYSANIEPAVIAFLRGYPQYFNVFNPNDRAFPTPRAWEHVAGVVKRHLPTPVENARIIGRVGQEAGIQLAAFLPVWRSTAGIIDAILTDPQRAPLPAEHETNLRVAIASALGNRATEQNLGAIITYMARLGHEEYGSWAIMDATYRDPKLYRTPEFHEWAGKHEILESEAA